MTFRGATNLREPIFIYSGWRAASTYFWSKFRAVPSTLSYYEPFHEQLAKLTLADISVQTPANSGLRHPGGHAPYLTEFADRLRPIAGVQLYEDRFALRSYFMGPVAREPQRNYVQSLIDHARGRDRTPVFGCCRTLGRVAWLKLNFGGSHLVLMRDPVSQWISAFTLRKKPRPTYFELGHLAILRLAGDAQPLARAYAERMGIPPVRLGADLSDQLRSIRAKFKRMSAATSFEAFCAVYILSYRAEIPDADLVIGVDRLSNDNGYASEVSDDVEKLSGLRIDFSDCRTARHERDMLDFNPDVVWAKVCRGLGPWPEPAGAAARADAVAANSSESSLLAGAAQ